jgi:hypothetical protein
VPTVVAAAATAAAAALDNAVDEAGLIESLSLPFAFSSRLHLALRFENQTCILDSVKSSLADICSLA